MARSSASGPSPLLRVANLTTRFLLPGRVVHAVEDVSLDVHRGETLGLVGESGSGKSATVMSILRLLPPTATVSGTVELEGQSLLTLSSEAMRRIRGDRVSLVPQNPLAALNPVFTVGWQLAEAVTAHRHLAKGELRQQLVGALEMAGLPDPEAQLDRYPHEFSGGMRQRILIAMAILNRPALLLADEPTTALDTTTQAQILRLLESLVAQYGMGLVLITHNMGVVATVASRVAVMYAGEIVEIGPTKAVFDAPQHPYTRLLLASSPTLGRRPSAPSQPVKEAPQSVAAGGCRFRARCPLAVEACAEHPRLLKANPNDDGWVRCWVAQAGD